MSVPSAAPHPDVIQARRASFSFGDAAVLRAVDFDVAEGTSTAIMGESGSGKSTLLQILAGILLPTEGTVLLDDESFSELSSRKRDSIRLNKFGFVFQFGELLPELSVAENVELPLLLQGKKRSEARTLARDALRSVGLETLGDRRLHQVSGGQQQRAAIARAVAHRPRILLADEPTGSLDESTSDEVLDVLLRSAAESGSSVVLVTHSRRVADRCQRMLLLRDGVLEIRQVSA